VSEPKVGGEFMRGKTKVKKEPGALFLVPGKRMTSDCITQVAPLRFHNWATANNTQKKRRKCQNGIIERNKLIKSLKINSKIKRLLNSPHIYGTQIH